MEGQKVEEVELIYFKSNSYFFSGYWLVDKDGNPVENPSVKSPEESPKTNRPEDFLTENYEISDLFSSSWDFLKSTFCAKQQFQMLIPTPNLNKPSFKPKIAKSSKELLQLKQLNKLDKSSKENPE